MQNSGIEGAVVVEKVRCRKEANYGFNVATEQYEELVKGGVIDPPR